MCDGGLYNFDEINLDFLELTPPQTQSLQTVHNATPIAKSQFPLLIVEKSKLPPQQRLSKKRQLAERIANANSLVQQIFELEKERNQLQQQLRDFQQSANEIQRLYENEKQTRNELHEKVKKLQLKCDDIDGQLTNKTFQYDQLQGQLDETKGYPVEYNELVIKYLKIAEKLNDEHLLHWQNQGLMEILQKYSQEKNLRLCVPKSPKKRTKIYKSEKSVQCDLWSSQPVAAIEAPMKETFTQGTQYDSCNAGTTRSQGTQHICTTTTKSQGTQHNSTTTRATRSQGTQHNSTAATTTYSQGTQLISATTTLSRGTQHISATTTRSQGTQHVSATTTRSQGTQHISTTTTRSTSTDCFIKKHSVGTCFPEPKILPPLDDMLLELLKWDDISPLSPIVDEAISIPPAKTKISTATIGTCTFLCNIQRHIDFVPQISTIKHSTSRPPSRLSYDHIKNEASTPPPLQPRQVAPTPNDANIQSAAGEPNNFPSSSITNLQPAAFEELWQVFGQMLFGLLQNRNVSQAQQSPFQPSIDPLNQFEFNNWMQSLYNNMRQQTTSTGVVVPRVGDVSEPTSISQTSNDFNVLRPLARQRGEAEQQQDQDNTNCNIISLACEATHESIATSPVRLNSAEDQIVNDFGIANEINTNIIPLLLPPMHEEKEASSSQVNPAVTVAANDDSQSLKLRKSTGHIIDAILKLFPTKDSNQHSQRTAIEKLLNCKYKKRRKRMGKLNVKSLRSNELLQSNIGDLKNHQISEEMANENAVDFLTQLDVFKKPTMIFRSKQTCETLQKKIDTNVEMAMNLKSKDSTTLKETDFHNRNSCEFSKHDNKKKEENGKPFTIKRNEIEIELFGSLDSDAECERSNEETKDKEDGFKSMQLISIGLPELKIKPTRDPLEESENNINNRNEVEMGLFGNLYTETTYEYKETKDDRLTSMLCTSMDVPKLNMKQIINSFDSKSNNNYNNNGNEIEMKLFGNLHTGSEHERSDEEMKDEEDGFKSKRLTSIDVPELNIKQTKDAFKNTNSDNNNMKRNEIEVELFGSFESISDYQEMKEDGLKSKQLKSKQLTSIEVAKLNIKQTNAALKNSKRNNKKNTFEMELFGYLDTDTEYESGDEAKEEGGWSTKQNIDAVEISSQSRSGGSYKNNNNHASPQEAKENLQMNGKHYHDFTKNTVKKEIHDKQDKADLETFTYAEGLMENNKEYDLVIDGNQRGNLMIVDNYNDDIDNGSKDSDGYNNVVEDNNDVDVHNNDTDDYNNDVIHQNKKATENAMLQYFGEDSQLSNLIIDESFTNETGHENSTIITLSSDTNNDAYTLKKTVFKDSLNSDKNFTKERITLNNVDEEKKEEGKHLRTEINGNIKNSAYEKSNSGESNNLLNTSALEEILTPMTNKIVDDLLNCSDHYTNDTTVTATTPTTSEMNETQTVGRRRARKRKSEVQTNHHTPCKRSERLRAKQLVHVKSESSSLSSASSSSPTKSVENSKHEVSSIKQQTKLFQSKNNDEKMISLHPSNCDDHHDHGDDNDTTTPTTAAATTTLLDTNLEYFKKPRLSNETLRATLMSKTATTSTIYCDKIRNEFKKSKAEQKTNLSSPSLIGFYDCERQFIGTTKPSTTATNTSQLDKTIVNHNFQCFVQQHRKEQRTKTLNHLLIDDSRRSVISPTSPLSNSTLINKIAVNKSAMLSLSSAIGYGNDSFGASSLKQEQTIYNSSAPPASPPATPTNSPPASPTTSPPFSSTTPASPTSPPLGRYQSLPAIPKEIPSKLKMPFNAHAHKRNSLLQRLIATYSYDQYQIINGHFSEQQLEERQTLSNELQKYFITAIAAKDANKAISPQMLFPLEYLDDISHSCDLIIEAIVEEIKKLPRSDVDVSNDTTTTTTNTTSPKHICIEFVLRQIHCRRPTWIREILAKVENQLFHYNSNKCNLNEALNLTQLYLLVIQINQQRSSMFDDDAGQRNLCLNPARLFIAKCLYYHSLKAIPMIYEVLCFYPTTLPHREDRTYDRSDALITVIQHLLMCTTYDMDNRDLRGKELLSKLRYQYHFEPFKPDRFVVLNNLIEKLKAGKLVNIKYAFAIFCKRMHPTKVESDVLRVHFMPLANDYYSFMLQSPAYDERIAALLDCISTVIKPFPVDADVSVYLSIFKRYLNAVERPLIQESAVQAILRLQRFGYVNCFNALLNFKPTYTMHDHTKAVLKTFIHRKPLHFWKTVEKQMFSVSN